MIQALILSVLSVCGLVGNSIIIAKFVYLKEKKLNFHRIMILLSIFDNVLIVIFLILFVAPDLSEIYKFGIFTSLAPIALPLGEIAITGSIYSTIAITIERFLVVCCPFYAVSHRWSPKKYILTIVIFSIIYNLPIFFEIETGIVSCKQTYNDSLSSSKEVIQYSLTQINENVTNIICSEEFSQEATSEFLNCHNAETCTYQKLVPTGIRKNYTYYTVYHITCDLVFKCIIPFGILIILNTSMIKRFIKFYS